MALESVYLHLAWMKGNHIVLGWNSIFGFSHRRFDLPLSGISWILCCGRLLQHSILHSVSFGNIVFFGFAIGFSNYPALQEKQGGGQAPGRNKWKCRIWLTPFGNHWNINRLPDYIQILGVHGRWGIILSFYDVCLHPTWEKKRSWFEKYRRLTFGMYRRAPCYVCFVPYAPKDPSSAQFINVLKDVNLVYNGYFYILLRSLTCSGAYMVLKLSAGAQPGCEVPFWYLCKEQIV